MEDPGECRGHTDGETFTCIHNCHECTECRCQGRGSLEIPMHCREKTCAQLGTAAEQGSYAPREKTIEERAVANPQCLKHTDGQLFKCQMKCNTCKVCLCNSLGELVSTGKCTRNSCDESETDTGAGVSDERSQGVADRQCRGHTDGQDFQCMLMCNKCNKCLCNQIGELVSIGKCTRNSCEGKDDRGAKTSPMNHQCVNRQRWEKFTCYKDYCNKCRDCKCDSLGGLRFEGPCTNEKCRGLSIISGKNVSIHLQGFFLIFPEFC